MRMTVRDLREEIHVEKSKNKKNILDFKGEVIKFYTRKN